MDERKVSIIVPTKNSSEVIDRCLKSIKTQTYMNIELINVDNNSSDDTKEIAARYAKVYDKGPERSSQRNFGSGLASGGYLMFIDSDMELEPGVVQECVDLCEQGMDAAIIEENNIGTTFWSRCRTFERNMYIGNEFIVAARFFRRAVFKECGGYDERFIINEDISLHHILKTKGFKIGRIKSRINHYESDCLKDIIKQYFYYGKTMWLYLKKHPAHSLKHHSIYRLAAYLKNSHMFLKNPIHGVGSLVRKLLEYLVVFCGMITAKLR